MKQVREPTASNRIWHRGPKVGESMNEEKIELTPRQRELLLRGLRYVRSSVAMDPQEYSREVEAARQRQYAEISELEALLNGATLSNMTSKV